MSNLEVEAALQALGVNPATTHEAESIPTDPVFAGRWLGGVVEQGLHLLDLKTTPALASQDRVWCALWAVLGAFIEKGEAFESAAIMAGRLIVKHRQPSYSLPVKDIRKFYPVMVRVGMLGTSR